MDHLEQARTRVTRTCSAKNHGQRPCWTVRTAIQDRHNFVFEQIGNSWVKGHHIEGAELKLTNSTEVLIQRARLSRVSWWYWLHMENFRSRTSDRSLDLIIETFFTAFRGQKTLPLGMRLEQLPEAQVRPHSARHLGGSPSSRDAVAPWLRRGRRHRSQVPPPAGSGEEERGGGRGEEAGCGVGEGEARASAFFGDTVATLARSHQLLREFDEFKKEWEQKKKKI